MTAVPKTIVAATDFSETAENAARVARNLSRQFEAQLHMLHVVVLLDDAHLEKDHRQQLEALVANADQARTTAMANGPAAGPDVEVTPHLVRGIAPGETIVETSSNLGSDLIVMGSHGRRGLSRLLLGSVAERVVRMSTVPVMTVRAEAAINPDGIKKILVPHDFSESSATAIRHATAWAGALGAEITLLHVVEPVVYPEFYSVDTLPDDLMARLEEKSKSALEAAAAELSGEVSMRLAVETGPAADTIIGFADPSDFDLVVMATRGLSGLEHILLGSVAESVIRGCGVPMLTIPG